MKMKILFVCVCAFLTFANGKKGVSKPSTLEHVDELRNMQNPYELLFRSKRSPICMPNPEGRCNDVFFIHDTPKDRGTSENVKDQRGTPGIDLSLTNKIRSKRSDNRCRNGKERVGCYICYCNIDKTYDICFPDGKCQPNGIPE